jgi:hypothetical protein
MPRDTYDRDFLNRVQDRPGWPADTARLIRLWRTFPGQWGEADPDGEACARLENLHAAATGLIKAEAERRDVDAGPPALWADLMRPEFIQCVMTDVVSMVVSLEGLPWPECAQYAALRPEQEKALRHVGALVKRLEAVVRKESRRDDEKARAAQDEAGTCGQGLAEKESEARRKVRLYVEDIDSFSLVREVKPSMVAHFLKDGCMNMAENVVKLALEQILHVPSHRKDSPAELDDIYTANVMVSGRRLATAFMLKGPGIGTKEMDIKHCGSKGNQLVRLFDAPAELFVVQFTGVIKEMVVKDVEGKVRARRAEGKPAQFLIMEGQDTARVLHAYGKLKKKRRSTG